jgi:hypothetical protein
VGDAPLCVRFPRLFSISLQKDAFINEIRVCVDGEDRWGWIWRRNLFAWEHGLLCELLVVAPMVPTSVEKDEWY